MKSSSGLKSGFNLHLGTMSCLARRKSSEWLLGLLAAIHLAAALSHFLLSVVSKSVAKDIHYGTQACSPNITNGNGNAINHSNSTSTASLLDICNAAKDPVACANIHDANCSWEYTGLGLDYQLLAGPSFMAVYTTTSILWGLAADRFNRTRLLALSSFIFSFAIILTSFTNSFAQLVLLRMILAAGVGGISPIAPGIIFDAFSEKHRALAMGFFHWGIYLGGGLSNAIGKGVSDLHIFQQGWRGAFLVSGIPGLVLGLLMLLTGEDPPRRSHNKRGDQNHSIPSEVVDSPVLPQRRSRKLRLNLTDDEQDFDNNVTEDVTDLDDDDIVEYESTNEAQVLIQSPHQYSSSEVTMSLWQCCLQPSVLLLGFGACIRQAAGYTWGYNSALFFQTYYPGFDASWWLTWITIFGGSIGVVFGGLLSDTLVSRLGLSGRALVLAVSQLISFPFALGTLWLDPPMSFLSLLIGYFFAEMWYGVVFAILVELLPSKIRSLGLAVALFVINNFGGNVPVFVSPLSTITTYRTALTFLYPGALIGSSFLFFMGYWVIKRK